jgi:ferritin-like metal-binding protein YciE
MNERRKQRKTSGIAADAPALFREYMLDELREVLWAERKLVKLFPKMEAAYKNSPFGKLLAEAKNVSSDHISGICTEFDLLHEKRSAAKCEAIDALLKTLPAEEGMIKEGQPSAGSVIQLLKKANQYKIGAYHALVQLARTLGLVEVTARNEQMLQQEKLLELELAQLPQ